MRTDHNCAQQDESHNGVWSEDDRNLETALCVSPLIYYSKTSATNLCCSKSGESFP